MIKEIKRRNARSILLQFPEGLRGHASRISQLVENSTDAMSMVSVDPCYGACDLPIVQAKSLGIDLIVHFGHTPYKGREEIPVLYVETPSRMETIETVRKALPFLTGNERIGLATTIQHVADLKKIETLLKERGMQPIVGKKRGKIKHDGQILGCDYSTMQEIDDLVDIFLLVGSMFHALGAALALRSNVVLVDPYQERIVDMREKKKTLLKRKWASISKAKRANDFGIIVGTKTGQLQLEKAIEIKKRLESVEKRATLLIASEVVPEDLQYFGEFGAYVNTACPRISIDDADRFKNPVISVEDFEIMIGSEEWDSYVDRIYPEK